MRWLLFVLTLVELSLVVGVLLYYLVAIIRSLRRTSRTLAAVTFGVRAIEVQTAPVGARLRALNASLEELAAAASATLAAPGNGGGRRRG